MNNNELSSMIMISLIGISLYIPNNLLLILPRFTIMGKIKQNIIITLANLRPNSNCLLFKYTVNLYLKKSNIPT